MGKNLAHIGKLVKPNKCVDVGTVFNRNSLHLSRLKTAPTDAFTDMSQKLPHTGFTALVSSTRVADFGGIAFGEMFQQPEGCAELAKRISRD